ncbi:1281_t:CDS:2, partial [Racocetra fulgida]
MQNLNDEKEIVLRSNCKDSKLELCKTALKNILSPTNQPDDAILKVLKALQECKILIEKSEITNITNNFIKFSEGLFSELNEVSSYIDDIIECTTIILNDTAKVNDLIDMLETSLSPNEFNKRISCVEGLVNSLDKIDNEIRQRLMSNYENRSIKSINNEFWKSHNYLIDNLLKLLNDHKKKSNDTLEIPKIDYEEIVSLWAKVKDKCKTDYLRANDAIVE